MKTIRLLFLMLICSIAVQAQTAVSGSIYTNAHWTASGSPYIVTGNLVVFNTATLTIDPGVTIKFNSGSGIELRGTMVAVGTPTDSIIFTSNLASPTTGCWTGIRAIWTTSPSAAGNQVKMQFVRGSFADIFMDMDIAYNGPYTFDRCHFDHCNKVNHDGGEPSAVWTSCKFFANNQGLEACQFYGRVSNSIFKYNVNGVKDFNIVDSCVFMYNTGVAVAPYGTTNHCTITNNNIGVNCYFNAVNNTFIDNTVTNNTDGVEIVTFFNGSINFTGNTICNNTAYNIKMMAPYSHNDADLSNNCWCSTDSVTIRAKIYDGYIDNSLGLVSFDPLGTGCPNSLSNVGIEENTEVLDVNVFPVPFDDDLTFEIKNPGKDERQLDLYDITGRLLVKQNFSQKIKIDASELKPGLYIYRISNPEGIIKTGKLIKK
ncbi:MAG: T9SS type A sorting domain-containing protein [Bacteroidia bacterium]